MWNWPHLEVSTYDAKRTSEASLSDIYTFELLIEKSGWDFPSTKIIMEFGLKVIFGLLILRK